MQVYAKDLSLSEKRKRRRRRRRSVPVCLRDPGPKLLFVPPHQTIANITNLRKFVTYRIWVRAYNSIGESPSSEPLEVTTHADSKLMLLSGRISTVKPRLKNNSRIKQALTTHNHCICNLLQAGIPLGGQTPICFR